MGKTSIHCPFAEVSNDHLHNAPHVGFESKGDFADHQLYP
jgi:hypothetical protein